LNCYLDSQYVDRLAQTPEAKLDIILSEEQSIRETAQLLEQLSSRAEVLNSEHIKAAPSFESRLHELQRMHVHQQDSASELNDECNTVVSKYNNVISLLSKQFVQWNELVGKLERESKQHKSS